MAIDEEKKRRSVLNNASDALHEGQPFNKVVVGVDGSEHSLLALRWAALQAATMRAPLEVVTAWTFPEEPAPLGIEILVPWQDELMAQARAKLDQIIAEVLSEDERSDVTAKVVRGHPAKVLLNETSKHDLLVVGSRGRGAFEELVFGSVSDHCVRYAPCTVVVVR
jgi:nucleotide-binding universal stress UspA family protein